MNLYYFVRYSYEEALEVAAVLLAFVAAALITLEPLHFNAVKASMLETSLFMARFSLVHDLSLRAGEVDGGAGGVRARASAEVLRAGMEGAKRVPTERKLLSFRGGSLCVA